MPILDVAGEYLEESRSEETHRRPRQQESPVARRPFARAGLAVPAFSITQLIGTKRRRPTAAGAIAVMLVVSLVWLLPKHDVLVAVDGSLMSVQSRSENPRVVASQAGVDLRPGDRAEHVDDSHVIVHRAITTTLRVDGKTYSIRSRATTIEELLNTAGVQLGQHDSVFRNGAHITPSAAVVPAGTGSNEAQHIIIDVRRPVPFTVTENGQQLALQSSRETVAAALRDAGVRVGAGDDIQPALGTAMNAGVQVRIEHASQLVVTMPQGKVLLYTTAHNVGDALTQSGVPLPPDYRLEPAADTQIAAGLAVHVVGISTEQNLETERVQSQLVYKPDASLAPGAQRVVEGSDGVHYRQYSVESQDGVVTSRELVNEWDDPPPVDTIVYYSTASTAAAVAAPQYNGNWRDLVCSYDWDCNWALAVIQCESNGHADSYNPAGYVGLFQIWQGYGSNLTDPATNIAAAYSLYRSGGRGNWPNCP